MKFILLIYLLLGTGMSAMISDGLAGRYPLDFGAVALLLAVHLPFALGGYFLAVRSRPTPSGYRYGLSPGAWGIGLVLSYLVGFIAYQVAK